MCSPRPQPTPPPAPTLAERNASIAALNLRISEADKKGDTLTAYMDRKLLEKTAAIPVDPNSIQFAPKVGTAGQTVAPSADHVDLAKEQLTGALAKRATSTLRIPTTTPVTTQ